MVLEENFGVIFIHRRVEVLEDASFDKKKKEEEEERNWRIKTDTDTNTQG